VPRFFFDTYDGERFFPDEEGQEMENINVAKREAEKALAEMARDGLPDGDQRSFIISVRDGGGEVVLRAALSLVVEYPSQPQD